MHAYSQAQAFEPGIVKAYGVAFGTTRSSQSQRLRCRWRLSSALTKERVAQRRLWHPNWALRHREPKTCLRFERSSLHISWPPITTVLAHLGTGPMPIAARWLWPQRVTQSGEQKLSALGSSWLRIDKRCLLQASSWHSWFWVWC